VAGKNAGDGFVDGARKSLYAVIIAAIIAVLRESGRQRVTA
jgi:hypothetical protein